MSAALERVVAAFAEHAGVRSKAGLRLIAETLEMTDVVHGPGDDAAVIAECDGDQWLAAGEAILTSFVEADPYAAGIAAVLANVNDIAAMGGRPLAIVDTIIGTEAMARSALEGIRFAAALYRVPVAGGHLTLRDGPAALSAFVVGRARRLLSAANVAPGQTLLFAACLTGRMRADFPFFSAVEQRREQMADDLSVLATVAERGDAVAAKDVSMAGCLGSLAMLLEPTGCGARMDLGRLPRPAEVALETWVGAFPSFAFLICAQPDRAAACREAFTRRGLACEIVGAIDASGRLRIELDGETAMLIDVREHGITNLMNRPTRRESA
jgi:selenophosphate synthetase-related protein